MLREIIKIDDEKCTGCGDCVPDCPEGAIQMIDGKARLVSDLFCDGLGACLKNCPVDAIEIETREAAAYNEKMVMENIVKYGENTVIAHLKHLNDHGEKEYLKDALDYMKENNIEIPNFEKKSEEKLACGCSGSMEQELNRPSQNHCNKDSSENIQSELRQWPIQLKLLNPAAIYFKEADLLICADCVPLSYGNFHKRFLKDKILILFCPKLDDGIDEYVEKLAEIFRSQDIKSITINRMEVPCCGGISAIVQKALELAKKNIMVKEYTISLQGDII